MRTTDRETQGDHPRTAHGAVRRNLPVAITIATLIGAGSLWAAMRIEDDLTTRSQAALLAAGIPARVHFQGLDAVLSGTVADAGQAAEAIGVVAGVTGTRHVTSRLSLAAGAAPTPPAEAGDAAGTTSPATPTAQLPRGSITFATGSATLSAPAMAYLDTVAAFLHANTELRIAVRGHADTVGPDELNWTLSKRRAEAAARYLEAQQVPDVRLHVEAFAATSPVASNDTSEGRAANRRVELAIEETP